MKVPTRSGLRFAFALCLDRSTAPRLGSLGFAQEVLVRLRQRVAMSTVYLGFFAVFSSPGCTKEVPVSELAARVNGAPILKRDFEQMASRKIERYERNDHKLEASVRDRIRDSVLRTMVEQKIVELEAKKIGVQVTDQMVDERFQEHKNRWRSEEQFQLYLKNSETSVETMKDDLRRNMLRDRVVEELSGAIEVTEDEIAKYYAKHPDRYAAKAAVRVSRIVLQISPGMSEAEKKAVRSKAEEVAAEAKKEGVSFAELARENSAESAPEGGKLRWIVRGRMPGSFDDVAFALEPNQVSDVIPTPTGFEIIKVWEKRDEVRRSLEEVHDVIMTSISAERRNKRRRDVLSQMRDGAKVEKFIEASAPRAPELNRPSSTAEKRGKERQRNAPLQRVERAPTAPKDPNTPVVE